MLSVRLHPAVNRHPGKTQVTVGWFMEVDCWYRKLLLVHCWLTWMLGLRYTWHPNDGSSGWYSGLSQSQRWMTPCRLCENPVTTATCGGPMVRSWEVNRSL